MRHLLRLLSIVLVFAAIAAQGQAIRKSEAGSKRDTLSLRKLSDKTTEVIALGGDVPGIDLLEDASPRHWIGDDSNFAARGLIDSTWLRPVRSRDSIVPDATVHWVRYHLLPQARLRGLPLTLTVRSTGPFTVYHNGELLVQAGATGLLMDERILTRIDSLPCITVPLTTATDGRPDVIAVRLTCPPGTPLSALGHRASLHTADVHYRLHRTMLHYGVFIGVNAIILVLALVIWRGERHERSWLLLALLSFVSALDTVCDLGGSQRALGFSDALVEALHGVSILLLPWPMYLLIMVLGTMRGDLSPRMSRWYTIGVLAVTAICAAMVVLDTLGIADTMGGLSFNDFSAPLVVGLMFAALVFGVVFALFGVEVIRLGIRLLRAKGYERWVGAGAVASLLLTLTLKVLSEFAGVGLSGWLSVLGDYCSYVAVPLSVAVFLAIRAADHNRLVARQRDELDAEVKERTAELRAEKERSDDLLLNILPEEVAEELKAKGAADARHFDQATVLFTDFRGFTQLSEQVGPAELVQELNACFKAFDAIMGRYRIEKIKTIGDSYMAAGGLPDPSHGGPLDVVLAALEMQAFMVEHKAERIAQGKPYFEMRVGIHSGPVVAGIVGVKKFQYDIWGDTVNTASRMESSGEIGRVNLSGATHALVKDTPGLRFIPRGAVQAKGKGEMEMWFVERDAS